MFYRIIPFFFQSDMESLSEFMMLCSFNFMFFCKSDDLGMAPKPVLVTYFCSAVFEGLVTNYALF